MAEVTMPIAEAARDRQAASQEPTGPNPALVAEPEGTPAAAAPEAQAAPLTPLGAIAESLMGLKSQYEAAKAQEMEARAAGAVQTAQATAQYEAAMEARRQAQESRPLLPPMPEAPKREIHEFLAPVEGESPTASITKLINAIGLFAAGAGGLAKGDAMGSLAALTGALKGWQDGDKEKADAALQNWEVATKAALTKWQMQRQDYLDIMADKNLTLDQIFQLWKIKAAQNENDVAASVIASGSLEKMVGWLHEEQKTAVHLEERMAALLQARQQFLERMEARKAEFESTEAFRREMAEGRRMYEQQIIDLRREGQAQTERIAGMNMDLKREALDLKREQLAQGQKPPAEEMKNYRTIHDVRDSLAEIRRLIPNVRLEKIMGGWAPTYNAAIEQGSFKGIPIPNIGKLSADESRFLAITRDLADVVLRHRSGAAVTDNEMARMLGFLVGEHTTPSVFMTRLQLAEDQTMGSIARFRDLYPSVPEIKPRNLSLGGWSAKPAAQ